jgi:hypothetical protein
MAEYNKNKGNAAVTDLVEEDEAPEEGEPSQSLAQRHDHHTRSLSSPPNSRRWPSEHNTADAQDPVALHGSIFTTFSRWAATVSVTNLLGLLQCLANALLSLGLVVSVPLSAVPHCPCGSGMV